MNRRQLIALAAAAAAVPALAAPAGAGAVTPVPCYKALPGPGGNSWNIKEDGTQDASFQFEEGSNFADGHGLLKVNGEAYPSIPGDENACYTTDTTILFPQRPVGGLLVRRRVASISDRIVRLDTITNTSDAYKLVQVELAIEVLGSQRSIDSESGDATVTTQDRWSVHENDGYSNPFLQWGQAGGFTPSVASEGDTPAVWQHKAGTMPDANLNYTDVPLPPHSTFRLLHVNGTTGDAATSEAAAKDTVTPFTGMTQHDAEQVVNWSNDPDGDGVDKFHDECPGAQGNQSDGCFTLKIKQPDGQDPAPEPGTPPQDAPQGGTPAGPTTPAPGTTPGGAADTTAPRITVTKLGRRAKRSRIARKGLAPRVACDESCSVSIAVKRRGAGRRRFRTIVSTPATKHQTAPRTIRVKLRPGQLRRLAGRRVRVVVTATDRAGNSRSVTRVVRIGR